jgi:DNA-directed RNA polymerase specialized sigma24 family protein
VTGAPAVDFGSSSRTHRWNGACSLRKAPRKTTQHVAAANSRQDEPEPELIGGARNGDLDAMAELSRRHYPYSVAVARRILSAQEEFLDAVQAAYLSAFQNVQAFRGDVSVKTWITRIVVNQCLMGLRHPGRYRTDSGLIPGQRSRPMSLVAIANRRLTDTPHINTPSMLSRGPNMRHFAGSTMSP